MNVSIKACIVVLLMLTVSSTPPIDGTAGDDNLTGTGAADTINGLGGNDTINGLGHSDTIDGGTGNDTIDGGAGDDTIKGGDGNDGINGSGGKDTINGGAGEDNIDGGDQNDTINGGADDDTIDGGNGDDKIRGGQGDDTIDGGSGNDRIRGGTGNDTYVTADKNGRDRIVIVAGDVPPGATETVSCGSNRDTVSLVDIGPGSVVGPARGPWTVTDPDTGGTYEIDASCEVLKIKGELLALVTVPVIPGTTGVCAWNDPGTGVASRSAPDLNNDGVVGCGIPSADAVDVVAVSKEQGNRESFYVLDMRPGGVSLGELQLLSVHTFAAATPGVRVVAVVDIAALVAEPSYPLVEGNVLAVTAGQIAETLAIRFKDGSALTPNATTVEQLLDPVFVNALPEFNGNVSTMPPDTYDNAFGDFDCNANGVADSEDIANGTSGDCNNNLDPDECDIASGYSEDSEADGIPDECQIPAVSEWGLAAMTLLVMAAATVVLIRRRALLGAPTS